MNVQAMSRLLRTTESKVDIFYGHQSELNSLSCMGKLCWSTLNLIAYQASVRGLHMIV